MKPYDNSFIECTEGLLDRFWIFRESDEELYLQVLDYEKDLREYFNEHFRYKLIVKPEFIRLEKVRESYQKWMDIDSFQNNRDFVMFYCLLAFLDEKVNQQFTLEDVCLMIVSHYPNEHIVWVGAEGFRNRMGLIRVLRHASEMNLITIVDRDIEGFKSSYEHEVLFEGTLMIKYYIRSFAFNLQEITVPENTSNRNQDTVRIMNELKRFQNEEEQGIRTERKHRIYRKLFVEPVVYYEELNEDEIGYIKQYGYSIKDHAEKYTHMQYEQYNGSVMLVNEEEYVNGSKKYYPETKFISKIAVLFGTYLRIKVQSGNISFNEDGSLIISPVEFREILQELKDETGANWTKTYKEMSMREFRQELLDYLATWKLATITNENDIKIHDTVARITGEFEKTLLK